MTSCKCKDDTSTADAEEARLSALRSLVDTTAEQLRFGGLSLADAIRLVGVTRERAAALIPDQMELYDRIYETRFTRLIWQFVLPKGS